MARIRTIKPEFWQDEALASCSPHARLLAIGLLQLADCQGRFKYIPMQVHAHVFPWETEVNIPALLGELEGVGYVKIYESQGKKYGHIPGFLRHQRLTGKEAESESQLPEPPTETTEGNIGVFPGKHPDAQEREREREQGNREKEQGKSISGHEPDATRKKPNRKKSNAYTPEFEAAWTTLPKRAGNNPKADAFKAWRARQSEGESPDAMAQGAQRYADYIAATGKAGTEYVMQGARFFGPSRPYEQDWTPPAPLQQNESWQAKAKRLGIEPKKGETEWQWRNRVEAA